MRELPKWILSAVVVIVAALGGFWLSRDLSGTAKKNRDDPSLAPRPVRLVDAPNPDRKAEPRHPSKGPIDLQDLLLGIPNERLVRFKDDQSYRDFLARMQGKNLRLLGKIDALRAVRICYDNLADLESLLGDSDDSSGNFSVYIPDEERAQVGAQPGALGFGRATLEWLGITGDNSSWGEGVRIAMLDTGIGKHSALPEGIREIDLITGDGPPIDLHGHGTAVAALLIGSDTISQGISPSATLLSIRIGDDTGSSNSFLLAEGIVRAVDEGAQIVNISMGSNGNSSLVREAVKYAIERGVVIVAAAGNDGFNSPSYPAAYEGVIAVGAVDRNGQHLDFSNTGEGLDMGAPGYEIISAWPGDQFTNFSGTSASAPIVAATIAATISQFGPISPGNAVALVTKNLDAAGAPGNDPQFGGGIIDVGRIMNSGTPGIYDAAIASNWYEAPAKEGGVGNLLVTVENRGTELLRYTQVEISVGASTYPMTVNNLQPGDSRVLTLPVNAPSSLEHISISSVLTLPGVEDIKPANNSLAGEIILVSDGPSQTTAANPPAPNIPAPPLRDTPGNRAPRQ